MSKHTSESFTGSITNSFTNSTTNSITNSFSNSITNSNTNSTTNSITNSTTNSTTNSITNSTTNSLTNSFSNSISTLVEDEDVGNSELTTELTSEGIDCVTKLTKKGAQIPDGKLWLLAASSGDIDELKHLIDRGVDENHTDMFGKNALWFAVCSGSMTVIRYLLKLGLATCLHTSTYCESHHMILPETIDYDWVAKPCLKAIELDNLPVVKLLEQHGCQTLKSFTALRHAVLNTSPKVVKLLLSRYKYPLNQEYIIVREASLRNHAPSTHFTILEESCQKSCAVISKLLIDHGAYPDQFLLKNAIARVDLELIALLIRTGVDVDYILYHLSTDFGILLLKLAVIGNRIQVTDMLLNSGFSSEIYRFMFNNLFMTDNSNPQLQTLMNKWRVQVNIVRPLQQSCRKSIVHHLYPRADRKVTELPLPTRIIKYLGYPELDAILDESTRAGH